MNKLLSKHWKEEALLAEIDRRQEQLAVMVHEG